MIGKIGSSKSFRSTLEYVFGENKKAKVIYGNFPEVKKNYDINSIVAQFEQVTKLKLDIKQPCYHLKFSPAIGDNLTDEDWAELSIELLKRWDLKRNQAVAVLHRDTKYPNSEKVREHLHLIVNKIDYRLRSSSPKLHYDYRKIKRFLREFEAKKNLTKVDYDYEQNMQERKLELEREKKISVGDWLKNLDDFNGEELKTKEDQINGIDLVSYGITSASSIVKLAVSLMPKAQTDEDRQKLDEVLNVAATIPTSEMKNEVQQLPVAELQRKLTSADIPEFSVQAQKLLKARIEEIAKLPNQQKEKFLIDSNPIYEKVLKYESTVNSMIEQLPPEYSVAQNSSFQFDLDAVNKRISILADSQEVYRAQTTEKGKWQEQINLLSDRQLKIIEKLPQNELEVLNEYAGRKATAFFAKHMNETRQKSFDWTSKISENGKPIVYSVSVSNRSKEGITIAADNNSGERVFKSEIANNGSVNIVTNKIPAAELQLLFNNNVHKQKNENKTKSSQRFSRQI